MNLSDQTGTRNNDTMTSREGTIPPSGASGSVEDAAVYVPDGYRFTRQQEQQPRSVPRATDSFGSLNNMREGSGSEASEHAPTAACGSYSWRASTRRTRTARAAVAT